jgi:TetR/AcrR family transcriptional regulator
MPPRKSPARAGGKTAGTASRPRQAKQKAKGKRTYDAEGSREKILQTATKHFVAKGYNGARVDEIVADADTSKNLVYYYFHNKEALFVAVLDRIYATFSAQRGEAWQHRTSPVDALRELAGEIFTAMVKMPEMISLLDTENLFRATHIKKLACIENIYHPLLSNLGDLLRRGEEAGVFRKGIDPTQLYISMSALCYHYISNQYTLSAIFGFDLMAPARLKARREHAVEMTLRFCVEPAVSSRFGLPD